MSWTTEQEQDLEKRWNAGNSLNDLVRTTGRTRGAIAGKLHRKGLMGNIKVRARRVAVRKPRLRLFAGGKVNVESAPVAVGPPSLQIPFMKLEDFHCRDETGTGADGLPTYCGHPVVYRSCCNAHAQINYRPSAAPNAARLAA